MRKRHLPVQQEELNLRIQRNVSYKMLLEDEPIVDVADNAYAFADKTYAQLPQRAQIECRKGCSFCCHIGVSCSAPEAIRIAEQICGFDPARQAAIRQRLVEREEQTRGRTKEDQFSSQVPCAFLDDTGACSIHDVRPLQCRAWNSLDRGTCEAAFNARDPAAATKIHGPARKLLNAIEVGMALGVEDAGLDGRGVRLMSAVRALLEDDTLGERWAAARRLPDEILEPTATATQGKYGTIEENDALLAEVFGR